MAHRALQFERRELAGLTWFILVAGILVSSIAWLAWRDHAREENRAELAQTAGDLSQRLAGNVRRHDQVLLSAAGLFAASIEVTRGEFSDFAKAVRLRRRLPDVRSIVWMRGRPGSVRAVYVTSRDGWASPGRWLGSVGGLAPALQEAADDDEAVLTKTYAERTGAPGDLAMVRPVYAGVRTPDSVRARRESLLGWVALKLRSKAFLTEDMRTFASHGRAVLFSPAGQPVSSSTSGSRSARR